MFCCLKSIMSSLLHCKLLVYLLLKNLVCKHPEKHSLSQIENKYKTFKNVKKTSTAKYSVVVYCDDSFEIMKFHAPFSLAKTTIISAKFKNAHSTRNIDINNLICYLAIFQHIIQNMALTLLLNHCKQ